MKKAQDEAAAEVPLYEETHQKTDWCPICKYRQDSGHINTLVRKLNTEQQNKAKQKAKEDLENNK